MDNMKGFLIAAISVLFCFIVWAFVDHYANHHNEHNLERHYRDYDPTMRNNIGNFEHQQPSPRSYYCPRCRDYRTNCSHYRQYDPTFNNGYYYCPSCRGMVRFCPHSRIYNPYHGTAKYCEKCKQFVADGVNCGDSQARK